MLCHWVKLVHTTITAIMTRKICDNFCPDSWILVSCWRPCSTAAGKPALQSSHLFASWPIFQTCDPNSLTRHRQRQERRITSYWRIIKGPTIVAQLILSMLLLTLNSTHAAFIMCQEVTVVCRLCVDTQVSRNCWLCCSSLQQSAEFCKHRPTSSVVTPAPGTGKQLCRSRPVSSFGENTQL